MKCEILVGNIASGKSTYSAQRSYGGAIILNDDLLVSALHGGHYKNYRKSYKKLYKAIEMQVIAQCAAMDVDVVIDRGLNVSRRARDRFTSYCRSMDIPCTATVFDFQDARTHAMRRCTADSRDYDYKYWLEVAERMLRDYECPQKDEGFAEINYRHWETNYASDRA